MAESFLAYLDAQFWEDSQAHGWQPENDAHAEWALMKILEAQAAVSAKAAEREAMLVKFDAYVERETRRALYHKARFEEKLHGYLIRLRDEGRLGRQKGYDLPSGRLQFRAVREKYEPRDQAALRAWAESHGYVKLKVEPDMELIQQMCAAGQEVPGMVLVRQAHEAFSVQFSKDEKDGER